MMLLLTISLRWRCWRNDNIISYVKHDFNDLQQSIQYKHSLFKAMLTRGIDRNRHFHFWNSSINTVQWKMLTMFYYYHIQNPNNDMPNNRLLPTYYHLPPPPQKTWKFFFLFAVQNTKMLPWILCYCKVLIWLVNWWVCWHVSERTRLQL